MNGWNWKNKPVYECTPSWRLCYGDLTLVVLKQNESGSWYGVTWVESPDGARPPGMLLESSGCGYREDEMRIAEAYAIPELELLAMAEEGVPLFGQHGTRVKR